METVPIKYPTPEYVTGELVFGDSNAEWKYMWVDEERTAEDVRAKVNPLTAFNIKTNEKNDLVGIQLVYAETGGSPIFEVAVKNRRLDETGETDEIDETDETDD